MDERRIKQEETSYEAIVVTKWEMAVVKLRSDSKDRKEVDGFVKFKDEGTTDL